MDSFRWDVLTNLFVVLLGFQADDLQDAGARDVRYHIRHPFPHAQQCATQHVVLTKAHTLQALLAFLNFLTLPIPKGQKSTSETSVHTSCCLQMSRQAFKTQVTDDDHYRRDLHCYFFMTKPQINRKSLRMQRWVLNGYSQLPAVWAKCINHSCLPVCMATLLEGEGKLVFPAVSGFLWSHLEEVSIHQNQQRADHSLTIQPQTLLPS